MVDRVGERFGNYTLTRLLGKGGFAEVYLGEHIHLNSLVAVKLLRTQLAEQEQEHFLQEARLIASLDHPAIVRVLDFAVEQDTAFLVMNYAPHGTLRQRHPLGTRVPIENILSYSKQIASALYYAHQHKVIHRDIKPENMLLGSHDEVLLSDFGIALISSSSSLQSTKDAAGTAIYMSPEQIMGKPRPASDQYALGSVIYEWLCGVPPFRGSFPELCAQHLYAPPPSLREKNPQVSQELEQVVMIALAKEPQQRFANVQAFVNALEQACQQTIPSITSLPPSPLAAETATTQDAAFVKMPSQEQDGTTAVHASFFATQSSQLSVPETKATRNSSAEESQNERITPVLPSLATKLPTQSSPQTSLHGDISPLATAPTANKIIEQGKIPSEQVALPSTPAYVTRRLPRGRKRLYILGTLMLVLAVLVGSFAFELQQSNASKGKTLTLTTVSTIGDTPITQSSQGPQVKETPTTTPKKTPLNTTAGSSPNTTATQIPVTAGTQSAGATATPYSTAITPPTTTPTSIATTPPIATPTAIPSTLTVSPSNLFDNLSSCQSDSHGAEGYLASCSFVLSNSTQTKKTLSWSASANTSTVSFDHSSGTIAPGQSTTVEMYATGQNCPFSITLSFQGTDNTVQVPLGCTQVQVTLGTNTLNSSNCTQNGNWTCVVPLAAVSENQTTSSWSTRIGSLTGVTFSQAQGTLAPGASTQVTITIASKSCPESGTIWFSVPGALSDGANYLNWSC